MARDRSETDPSSSFYGQYGRVNLTANVTDLLFASMDTTAATLAWALLFMANHNDCQMQIQGGVSLVTFFYLAKISAG